MALATTLFLEKKAMNALGLPFHEAAEVACSTDAGSRQLRRVLVDLDPARKLFRPRGEAQKWTTDLAKGQSATNHRLSPDGLVKTEALLKEYSNIPDAPPLSFGVLTAAGRWALEQPQNPTNIQEKTAGQLDVERLRIASTPYPLIIPEPEEEAVLAALGPLNGVYLSHGVAPAANGSVFDAGGGSVQFAKYVKAKEGATEIENPGGLYLGGWHLYEKSGKDPRIATQIMADALSESDWRPDYGQSLYTPSSGLLKVLKVVLKNSGTRVQPYNGAHIIPCNDEVLNGIIAVRDKPVPERKSTTDEQREKDLADKFSAATLLGALACARPSNLIACEENSSMREGIFLELGYVPAAAILG